MSNLENPPQSPLPPSLSAVRPASPPKASLAIIFLTVFIDLIGFGMVIPLISTYGRHYGATGLELPILGSIYSLMQFFFSPLWGKLSDRIGRRPVILLSLVGSTVSYFIFGLAPSYSWLLASRALGGICAANISTAQAYIADITTPADRAKGMGLIGAAFGLGFTLGPPLGGIAATWSLALPGLIAGTICGLNALFAYFRLPESYSPLLSSKQRTNAGPVGLGERYFPSPSPSPSQDALPQAPQAGKPTVAWSPWENVKHIFALRHQQGDVTFYYLVFFGVTLAFTMLESTFSLLFQSKFHFATAQAGLKTGLVLMASGLVGALVQGWLIRKWVPRWGEVRLLMVGLLLNTVTLSVMPYLPSYESYFLIVLPLSLGTGLVNPALAALISRSAASNEQGSTLGMSQALSSLARCIGPFLGLLSFDYAPSLPYGLAAGLTFFLWLLSVWKTAAV